MEKELTYEETNLLIEARFRKYPELGAIANGDHFDDTLIQILDFEGVDHDLFDLIKDDVLMVLSLYAPLNELAGNIEESTGLTKETATRVASLVETLILQPVYTDLVAYQYLWAQELEKEKDLPTAPKSVPEKLDLGPETMKKPSWNTAVEEKKEELVPVLGSVPDASNDLKERLELRPKTLVKRAPQEPKIIEETVDDTETAPLTRTQILQSLTSKRTMASDIASIHKPSDTHT